MFRIYIFFLYVLFYLVVDKLAYELFYCKFVSDVKCIKLQLHVAIYRLRFYSNSLIHMLWLSNSHSNVASLQKNRGDKSHHVIVALILSPCKPCKID